MPIHILFEVIKSYKLKALKFLSAKSKEPLYQIEEKSLLYIGGFFDELPSDLPEFLKNYSLLNDSINWEDQWEEFSPHMQGHLLQLDLSPYGKQKAIQLKPGPGFGDLSHPTTQLSLQAMSTHCKGCTVIDFGCGSGILSVAAWAFGAERVYSLEIDPISLIHAKENLLLNHYPTEFVLETMPIIPPNEQSLCVINMTFGEQKIALQTLPFFPKNTKFLSSGILKEQKVSYIKWGKDQGITFTPLNSLEGWVVFEGFFY